MEAEYRRDWNVFKQIFSDHWEGFKGSYPQYDTPYHTKKEEHLMSEKIIVIIVMAPMIIVLLFFQWNANQVLPNIHPSLIYIFDGIWFQIL